MGNDPCVLFDSTNLPSDYDYQGWFSKDLSALVVSEAKRLAFLRVPAFPAEMYYSPRYVLSS